MKHDKNLIALLKRYPLYKKLYDIIGGEIERRRSLLRVPVKLPPDMFNLTIEKFERPLLRGRYARQAQREWRDMVYSESPEGCEYNYGYSPMEVLKALTEKRSRLSARIRQIESAMEILTDEQREILDASIIMKDREHSIEAIADAHYVDRATLYRQRDEALRKLGYLLGPCLDELNFSVDI